MNTRRAVRHLVAKKPDCETAMAVAVAVRKMKRGCAGVYCSTRRGYKDLRTHLRMADNGTELV